MRRLWLRLALGIGGTLVACWIFAGMVFEHVLPAEFETSLLRLLADDILRVEQLGAAAIHEDFGYTVRLERGVQEDGVPIVVKRFGEPPEIWVPVDEGSVVLVPAEDDRPPLGVFVVVFITVALVVASASWVLGAPMVRRLTVLGDAARRFGEGDSAARARLPAGDAIGDVAQQFDRMAERIEALLVAQEHLLQAVSHELRTPAARVRFGLELLAEAKTDDERKRLAASMDEDVAELDTLIEELLTWVRLGSGLPADARLSVEVSALTERLAHELGALRPNITLTAQCEPELVLLAEPRQYARVVRNLVGNALDHARSRVELRLFAGEAGHAHLIVDDDGDGIPTGERARVFEPFVRIARATDGAGLGLAIVHRAVLAHGGTVTIEDSPLGGARLTVRWPRGAA